MPEQTRRFIFVSEAIVFTSGKGGVGKTTVISNIGVELSQLDKKVIMLDTDMGLRLPWIRYAAMRHASRYL